mmetsp:Transcript_20273/g.42144  ORF Transcript_20273/g.42144 Transcript_20273/m.42144 type:complete len:481 (-) Transcript_20273:5-1447(-)
MVPREKWNPCLSSTRLVRRSLVWSGLAFVFLLVSLVQSHPLDLPVGIALQGLPSLGAVEVGVAGGHGIVVHVVFFVEGRAVGPEAVPGDGPAKGEVDDDPVVSKALRRAAGSLPDGKVGVGGRPFRGIGPLASPEGVSEVGGDLVPRKDPRPDVPAGGVPLQGVDAAAGVVAVALIHGCPDRPVLVADGDAPLVGPLVRRLRPAVVRLELRVEVELPGKGVGEPRRRVPVSGPFPPRYVGVHVASLRRVEGRLGDRLGVDGLDDVDLPVVRPGLLVRRPKGRPDPAAGGHPRDVQEDQPVVEAGLPLEPDGIPEAVPLFVVVFHGLGREVDVAVIAVVRPCQAELRGLFFPDVGVVPRGTGRVRAVFKVVVVEEGPPLVGLDQGIGPRPVRGGRCLGPRGDPIGQAVDLRAEAGAAARCDHQQQQQQQQHQRRGSHLPQRFRIGLSSFLRWCQGIIVVVEIIHVGVVAHESQAGLGRAVL